MSQNTPMHFFFKFGLLVQFGFTLLRYGTVEGYMVGTNPYHRLETLDTQGKYVLEWEVDWSAKRVTFNVTVATRGYVGFGLSDNGKMSGADIVIGGVLPNGQSYFSDRHAVTNQLPEEDPSQDWDLHYARENKTHTFLSFSRPFDTCNPQDYRLVVDKVSLIWAYGENDDNLEYHHWNRGEYPVHLLNPDYTSPIERDPKTNFPVAVHSPYHEVVKVWSWKLSYTMPADDTTYWCTMNKGPVLPRKHHMIGFEMRFNDEVSRRHVHHVIISKCHAPQGFNDRSMFHRYLDHQGHVCYGAGGRSQTVQSFSGPIPLEYCSDYLTAAAVGNRVHFYPPHVGNPFGETRDEYYMIQVHYDNPEMRTGIQAEVHLDIFYTPNLREHEGDLLVLRHESPGLPTSHLIPPSSINHVTYGICGSECSRKILPKEGIRVHSTYLHSHNSGTGIRVRHFRNTRELPFIAAEDNYAFNYQQTRPLVKEVHVLPGDQFTVECLTDSTWTNGSVVGGFSTRQEMCVAWFFYYNRLPNNMICSSEIDSPEFREKFFGIQNTTWSNQHLDYVVDAPRNLAGLTVKQVSDGIEWNLGKREELQRFQVTHAQVNRCPVELYARRHGRNANGEPVDLEPEEGLGRLTPIPRAAVPYTPPQSACSRKGGEYKDSGKKWSRWG